MTGTRLLITISLVCSASAFAQMQTDSASPANRPASAVAAGPSATKSPAQFHTNQLSDPFLPVKNGAESQKLLLEPFPQNSKEDEILLKRTYSQITAKNNPFAKMVVPFLAGSDSYCLKIRSYVVARDSENSDAVHPAGYTTCVPASRFRLKTTVEDRTYLIQR